MSQRLELEPYGRDRDRAHPLGCALRVADGGSLVMGARRSGYRVGYEVDEPFQNVPHSHHFVGLARMEPPFRRSRPCSPASANNPPTTIVSGLTSATTSRRV